MTGTVGASRCRWKQCKIKKHFLFGGMGKNSYFCTEFLKHTKKMKKVLLTLFAVMALSFGAFAGNDAYTVDDNAIEQAFAEAAEVSVADVQLFADDMIGMQSMTSVSSASYANPWPAFAICYFLGGFGIHRHYLGTSKPMWLYYTLTCGGVFGIAYTIDTIVLFIGAIQNDISRYCNNDSFFMWL